MSTSVGNDYSQLDVDSVNKWRLLRPAAGWKARPLRVSTFGCQTFEGVEPQALGITYWFEPVAEGKPYPVTIRFTGRRSGTKSKSGPRDTFVAVETVETVVPGSGPIAVTTRIHNARPGEWHVAASPVGEPRPRSKRSDAAALPDMPRASSSGRTGFAPVVGILAPGARLGIWPALVGLGAAAGLSVQALLASHFNLSLIRVFLVSLTACLVGLVGAKLYYLIGHLVKRDLRRGLALLTGGMCIQGFVLGAVGAFVIGASVAEVSVGRLLDVAAPGLMLGMTIGRFGCFFGGCCAGRATASRWGLWSSDRRLGMKRIPTQLLESAVALVIGLAAFAALWTTSPQPPGVVFVAAIAAYTFARQLLFPLRAGPRHTAHGRPVMMAVAGVATLVSVVLAAISR